jgi:hypothetical protein
VHLEALDQAKVAWRIAAVSPSLTGLWATAMAGLGITVRGGIGLPAGLVASARMFDLPALSPVPITLHWTNREKAGGGGAAGVDCERLGNAAVS